MDVICYPIFSKICQGSFLVFLWVDNWRIALRKNFEWLFVERCLREFGLTLLRFLLCFVGSCPWEHCKNKTFVKYSLLCSGQNVIWDDVYYSLLSREGWFEFGFFLSLVECLKCHLSNVFKTIFVFCVMSVLGHQKARFSNLSQSRRWITII